MRKHFLTPAPFHDVIGPNVTNSPPFVSANELAMKATGTGTGKKSEGARSTNVETT